jgi:serine/alanine adding enzyme
MKVIEIINDDLAWDRFVESSPRATAYHLFGWKAVFAESFGHRSYYLAAIDENGNWQGILPLTHMRSRLFGNFLVSLPFVNYGGVVCNSVLANEQLVKEAERIRHACGATHVELRQLDHLANDLPTKKHKVTMMLDLIASIEDTWKAFDPKLRNQIRKAQKQGLRFELGRLNLLDDFYGVFARNMRDLGTPVYAKKFFSNVLEEFPDSTAIGAVYYQEKCVASGFASWLGGHVDIPWASSLREYNAVCPNHMLYWELIRFAIDSGFTTFDFGRSTRDEGTYNFKKTWGARPVQLNWQYLMDKTAVMPELSPRNPRFQVAIRVWRTLPVPITNLLGPLIVRNIP